MGTEFEQQGAILLAQSDGCAVWQFRNETGDGTMTTYEVFPGVVLSFNDFHMERFESSYVADRRLFAIDHCREGRMEYSPGSNMLAYTAAGDMKLDLRLQHTGTFIFPSHHYHGLTIAFDRDLVRESLPLADRFLHAPLGDVEHHSIGEIKTMMVDKIENLEPPLAHMIPEGAGHIVLPILSIAALLCINWRLALASLVTFPLSFLCMGLTFQISGSSFTQYDRSASHMNSAIVEYIESIEVIKAFGRAGVSYEKYAGAITDFRTFVVKWLTSTLFTMKLSFALFPSTLIGTLPAELALANSGTITGPQAALAVMLSISMVGSLAKLEVFSENMRQVKFTVEGLEAFLEMPALPEPDTRAVIQNTDVTLENVHFSYTGSKTDEVLHGIDLTLPEGSFTALVGPSGGGKSTVAKLIARFWDVTAGTVSIGGVNIKDMPLSQLSEYVSFVTQDNFLFRCSLLENIRLDNPSATDEKVRAAARKAQCEGFISKLPQGYDTPAGEAGKKLSGGEKQRISIARAILKNAPIIILDEATASFFYT